MTAKQVLWVIAIVIAILIFMSIFDALWALFSAAVFIVGLITIAKWIFEALSDD